MFLESGLVLVVGVLVLVLGILARHLFVVPVAFEFELPHKEGSRIVELDAVQHSTLGVAGSTPVVGAVVDTLEGEGSTLEAAAVVDGTCCFP